MDLLQKNQFDIIILDLNMPNSNIEWKTGFFWQKKWGGKITNSGSSGNIRIQFNRVTYGDAAGN